MKSDDLETVLQLVLTASKSAGAMIRAETGKRREVLDRIDLG